MKVTTGNMQKNLHIANWVVLANDKQKLEHKLNIYRF